MILQSAILHFRNPTFTDGIFGANTAETTSSPFLSGDSSSDHITQSPVWTRMLLGLNVCLCFRWEVSQDTRCSPQHPETTNVSDKHVTNIFINELGEMTHSLLPTINLTSYTWTTSEIRKLVDSNGSATSGPSTSATAATLPATTPSGDSSTPMHAIEPVQHLWYSLTLTQPWLHDNNPITPNSYQLLNAHEERNRKAVREQDSVQTFYYSSPRTI